MKTLLYILIFNLSAISFAQDPQLFENTWYLHKITIEDVDYFAPNLEPISFGEHIFTENPYRFYTGYCDSVDPLVAYDNQNNIFSLEDSPTVVPGSFCSFPENDIFNGQYFSILYTTNLIAKNPFSYSITSNGTNKELEIINPDGDKAIYGNQRLATPDVLVLQFSIYPNPVKNELFLSSKNGNGKLNVKIFNIEGKVLITQNLAFEKPGFLDVSNLSTGIYFLNIKTENGNVEVKKFIKK